MTTNIVIRKAIKEDMPNVIDMIQELADFEKMSDCPQLKVEDLIRDGGFNGINQQPLFICFIAEKITTVDDKSSSLNRHLNSSGVGREPIGYALCYYYYSTWEGKSLFLEDLYVRPANRKSGVGKKLFNTVEKFAKDDGCLRLDFQVLNWNPAIGFYERLGATNLTAAEGWQMYRVNL